MLAAFKYGYDDKYDLDKSIRKFFIFREKFEYNFETYKDLIADLEKSVDDTKLFTINNLRGFLNQITFSNYKEHIDSFTQFTAEKKYSQDVIYEILKSVTNISNLGKHFIAEYKKADSNGSEDYLQYPDFIIPYIEILKLCDKKDVRVCVKHVWSNIMKKNNADKGYYESVMDVGMFVIVLYAEGIVDKGGLGNYLYELCRTFNTIIDGDKYMPVNLYNVLNPIINTIYYFEPSLHTKYIPKFDEIVKRFPDSFPYFMLWEITKNKMVSEE